MFKVVVTDSLGNTATSNILLYAKEQETLPVKSYYYIGNWDCPDKIHDPEINCWVDYIDEYGKKQRVIIGCRQNGCQEVIASSIVDTNGVTDKCISE